MRRESHVKPRTIALTYLYYTYLWENKFCVSHKHTDKLKQNDSFWIPMFCLFDLFLGSVDICKDICSNYSINIQEKIHTHLHLHVHSCEKVEKNVKNIESILYKQPFLGWAMCASFWNEKKSHPKLLCKTVTTKKTCKTFVLNIKKQLKFIANPNLTIL